MKLALDTSALIAVIAGEPERDAFSELLLRSEPVVSAGTVPDTMSCSDMVRAPPSTASQAAIAAAGMRARASPPRALASSR